MWLVWLRVCVVFWVKLMMYFFMVMWNSVVVMFIVSSGLVSGDVLGLELVVSVSGMLVVCRVVIGGRVVLWVK